MRKKTLVIIIIIFTMVSSFLEKGTTAAEENHNVTFLTDTDPLHWSYPAIRRVVMELGILETKSPGEFKGNDLSTRYEVAKAFYTAAIKLEFISSLDLKIRQNNISIQLTDLDPEYAFYVNSIINEYGLMQAFEGNKFLGSRRITRYELAYELNNYLSLLETVVAKTSLDPVNTADKFTDIADDHWAAKAVRNIVNKYQIMSGYPNKEFRGGNTLTRYELVSVLNNFVQYIDKYLIPLPKYIPMPSITPPPPVTVPVPTPLPTALPTPVPTLEPVTDKTPLNTYDFQAGLLLKASYPGSSSPEIDILAGPSGALTFWFPKFNDFRLGGSVNGFLLNYGKTHSDFHKVANLKRNAVGAAVLWRILGPDYIEDPSLILGLGYENIIFNGSGYNYVNHGPVGKLTFEYPVFPFVSVIAEEKIHLLPFFNKSFSSDVTWRNDFTIGANIPAFTSFSVFAGYIDTRYQLSGSSEVYGDIGGVIMLRIRL